MSWLSKAWSDVKHAVTDIRDVVEAPIAAISSGVASKGATSLAKHTGQVLSRATGIHNWNDYRDYVESNAVVMGNFFFPGSSLVTSRLVSKGAQESLQKPEYIIANLAAGYQGTQAGQGADMFGAQSAGKAVGNITNSTVAASATTGAVQGAGYGAAEAAASGQNIGKGALKGGVSGGVAAGVTTALMGPAGQPMTSPSSTGVSTYRGWQVPEALQTGASSLGQGAAQGIGTFAGQEAIGKTAGESARAGLASGAARALFPTPQQYVGQDGKTVGKDTSGFERQATSQALSQFLAPKDTGGNYQPSSGAASTVLSATQQVSPSSAALAQALRVGDAGGPIFGSQGEDKKKKGAWNLESLRYMG